VCFGLSYHSTISYALSLYADLPIVLTIVHLDGTPTLSLHSRCFLMTHWIMFSCISIRIEGPMEMASWHSLEWTLIGPARCHLGLKGLISRAVSVAKPSNQQHSRISRYSVPAFALYALSDHYNHPHDDSGSKVIAKTGISYQLTSFPGAELTVASVSVGEDDTNNSFSYR
jgi:hypothetical protein